MLAVAASGLALVGTAAAQECPPVTVNECCDPANSGTTVIYAGDDSEVITIDGGQISGAGATLFVDFFRAPASTNDWIDVDNDGLSGYFFPNGPFPFIDQLAEGFTPTQPLTSWWMFQYRSVGSVNGFNEFVQNQLCGTIPTSIPAEGGIFNRFEYATGGVSNNGLGANGSGTVVAPCEINFSFLDVPSAWAARVPGDGTCQPGGSPACSDDSDCGLNQKCIGGPKWNAKPTAPGYGRNPITSNTGYVSNLESLSRVCSLGNCSVTVGIPCDEDSDCPEFETCEGESAPVSLNNNYISPNNNTIYDFIGAWVPVAYIANRGANVQDVRYSEMQYLFGSGRMPTGENLVGATRSVGSGTRNAIMNSTGIDTSWGRGDNIGHEFAVTGVSNIGPNHQSVNCQGSSQIENAVQMRRLAVGYTGLALASRAASDALAGLYEVLNVCKDVDENGDPLCDCTAQACAQRMGCSNDPSIACTNNTPCLPNGTCIVVDAAAANNGYVRPKIGTVLDNCDACCGYEIGGNGSFVTRGDPDANRTPPVGSNPALNDQPVADYINNIADSVAAFAGGVFTGQCNVSETCSVKRCAGNNAVCTGTGNGNCASGQGPCNFVVCNEDSDCAPDNGTCGLKPCSTDSACPDKACSITAVECIDDTGCPDVDQTCVGAPSGNCSVSGDPCTNDLECPDLDQSCENDYCRQSLNMPGQFLATQVFLGAGIDCTQSTVDGMAFADTNPLNQTLQEYIRSNNGLGIGGDTPNYGSVNTAGRTPTRKTGTTYSDGQTGGSVSYLYWNGASFVNVGTNLSKRNRVQGDFNEDGKRSVDDAVDMVKAYYTPRDWQRNDPQATTPGTAGFDLGSMTVDNAVPEIIGDHDGDGSLTKEDLRYFADGLAMVSRCHLSDTVCVSDAGCLAGERCGRLDRKAGAIAIDDAIVAFGHPIPWADPAKNLLIPGAPAAEPTFATPKDVNDGVAPMLVTGATYENGDFRADVAGRMLDQSCLVNKCNITQTTACTTNSNCPSGEVCLINKCSITQLGCVSDSNCPDLPATAAGAEPRGWDGFVDDKDINYCCRFANYGHWSRINDAVYMDLSCDMNGDLDVTSDDIEEIVLDILETQYGDVDLDGDRDQDDMDVINNAITTPPSCNADVSCGWRDGDMNCDGVVDTGDRDALPAAVPQLRMNRYLEMSGLDGQSVAAGVGTAIRVTMGELQNPDPPNAVCCPAPNFSAFEGQIRWIGPPAEYPESAENPAGAKFDAALLRCTPYYHDWSTVGTFYITGPEIMPSSTYRIDSIPLGADVNDEENFEAPTIMHTARWGDLVADFCQPGPGNCPTTQPDFVDISGVVDKFKSTPTSVIRARAQLQPQVPVLTDSVSFLDISACVDAFKGVAFPAIWGPCSCPAPTCPTVDACGRCEP